LIVEREKKSKEPARRRRYEKRGSRQRHPERGETRKRGYQTKGEMPG
jgi:hypothetical protein